MVLIRRLPPAAGAPQQRGPLLMRGAQGLEANVSHSVVALQGHCSGFQQHLELSTDWRAAFTALGGGTAGMRKSRAPFL